MPRRPRLFPERWEQHESVGNARSKYRRVIIWLLVKFQTFDVLTGLTVLRSFLTSFGTDFCCLQRKTGAGQTSGGPFIKYP
jgi:hypothetical protein